MNQRALASSSFIPPAVVEEEDVITSLLTEASIDQKTMLPQQILGSVSPNQKYVSLLLQYHCIPGAIEIITAPSIQITIQQVWAHLWCLFNCAFCEAQTLLELEEAD